MEHCNTVVPSIVLVLAAVVDIVFSGMGGKEVYSETGCNREELLS